jgi:hypothetical protein
VLSSKGISVVLLALCGAQAGLAGTVNLSGVLGQDDSIQVFTFSVQNDAAVSVRTTSFAAGGFVPILALFGPGTFFAPIGVGNDCGNFGTDAATGFCNDTELQWNALAGQQYFIALTEYDNYAIGPTLADGFTRQGMGNFTAELPFNNPVPGGSFLYPDSGAQRTNAWAVTFASTDPTLVAAAVPEPSSGVLLLAGAFLLARLRKTRNSRN